MGRKHEAYCVYLSFVLLYCWTSNVQMARNLPSLLKPQGKSIHLDARSRVSGEGKLVSPQRRRDLSLLDILKKSHRTLNTPAQKSEQTDTEQHRPVMHSLALNHRLNGKTQSQLFYSHRWSELLPPFFHTRNACGGKDEGENCCCLPSSSPHSVPGHSLGLFPVVGLPFT